MIIAQVSKLAWLADTYVNVANLAQIILQAAQLAQRQVDVWELDTELLVQFLLEVSRTDIVDHWRLNHHDNNGYKQWC